MNVFNRCLVTNNPCGTDTWQVGYACSCEPCQHYLRVEAAKKRLGPTVLGDVAKALGKKPLAEVMGPVLARLARCPSKGCSRNPVGVCVYCKDDLSEYEP